MRHLIKGFWALLLIALFLPGAGRGQSVTPVTYIPFASGNDTLGSITNVDSVSWQVRASGLNWPGAWNQFSTYITAANKSGEESVVYPLAQEAKWTHGQEIRFKIDSPAGTLTSSSVNINRRLGALTLHVQPDTITVGAQDTTLYLVRLTGQ